jgi:Domain of unknown function (DUF4258)
MKKLIPYLLVLVLFVVALFVKQCREARNDDGLTTDTNKEKSSSKAIGNLDVFRDENAEYFFTKHARCRMECRHITQREVKEVVRKADVNYSKSELDAPRGSKYALEGYTSEDKQHIRIIVAPKQKHLTIVTVIDLDEEWSCGSCK